MFATDGSSERKCGTWAVKALEPLTLNVFTVRIMKPDGTAYYTGYAIEAVVAGASSIWEPQAAIRFSKVGHRDITWQDDLGESVSKLERRDITVGELKSLRRNASDEHLLSVFIHALAPEPGSDPEVDTDGFAIGTRTWLTSKADASVLAHEYGHCFGLAPDRNHTGYSVPDLMTGTVTRGVSSPRLKLQDVVSARIRARQLLKSNQGQKDRQ